MNVLKNVSEILLGTLFSNLSVIVDFLNFDKETPISTKEIKLFVGLFQTKRNEKYP